MKTMQDEPRRPWCFRGVCTQFLATLGATIGAISDGMQFGWTAPLIPVLQGPDSPVKISDKDVVWIEGIYLMGAFAGLPFTIYCVKYVGPKRSVIYAAVVNLIAWTIIGIAKSVECLCVARFLFGMAGDMAFVAAPMYISEISQERKRGSFSTYIFLTMLIGVLIIYCIGPFVEIYVSSLVGGGIILIQIVTFSFMPESPYYLLTNGKSYEAFGSLFRLRSVDESEVDRELQYIKRCVERQNLERGRPQDLFLIRSNFRAFMIIATLDMGQQFCGFSVLLMNMHTILKSADSNYLGVSATAILFASLMLAAATVITFVIDYIGRKILLILSSILTSIAILILAIYFHLKYLNFDLKEFSWVPMVSVMAFAVVFKLGLGIVPMVLTAEVFASKVKALGMTLSDTIYVLTSLLSIYIYQYLSDMFGKHVPFYFFAGYTMGMAWFCFRYVPETKGKTLEEIQMILKMMDER